MARKGRRRPPVRLYRLAKGRSRETHVLAHNEAQARSWAVGRFVRSAQGLVVEQLGRDDRSVVFDPHRRVADVPVEVEVNTLNEVTAVKP